jgi:hypothetical protein
MEFFSATPQASVIEVKPELAQQLLNTSPGNRRMRSWYIDQLGAAMKSGDWLVTSQGIGIDCNGQLRDAHHRLTACVRHQSPFWSVIAWGLPSACYQVIDRGLARDYSDILDQPKHIAEVLRLGASICLKINRPSAKDIEPYKVAGLACALDALNKWCSTKVRYFSSAPVRLAAAVTIINGGDADYVNQQYKALVLADYDSMSSAAKALTRQVTQMSNIGASVGGSNDSKDKLARSLKVFDKDRQYVSKIQISDADKDSAIEFVRSVLNNSVTEHFSK